MTEKPRVLVNFKDIVDDYEVFVFPIFGVMHDGSRIDEDVFTILENLSRLNKTVSILTNLCRRRQSVIKMLASYGISPAFYQHIITAGEETHHFLKSRHQNQSSNLGKKCYIISPSDSLEVIEGVAINRVRYIEDADFILTLGVDEWHGTIDHYLPILKTGFKKNLRMVCGNPDYYVTLNGEPQLRAGSIAHEYEKLGGIVYYIGKPKMSFYHALSEDLKPFSKQETLIIGDSVKVDILGSVTAGYDSLLVINKTTIEDLCLSHDKLNDVFFDEVVDQLSAQDVMPTYMTKRLMW